MNTVLYCAARVCNMLVTWLHVGIRRSALLLPLAETLGECDRSS